MNSSLIEPRNRSADLQSACRSKAQKSVAPAESRLQIGAPVHGGEALEHSGSILRCSAFDVRCSMFPGFPAGLKRPEGGR